MSFYDKLVPEGYEIEKTDERVEGAEPLRFLTKSGAKRHIKNNPPYSPTYHLRVERKSRWLWNVVAYQNRLRKSL